MKPKQSKFVTPLSFRGWPYQPPIQRATLVVDKPKRRTK